MYPIDLSGKTAIVFGVANQRSIAWNIASILDKAGASVVLTYQNERFKSSVEKLSDTLQNGLSVECDVSDDESIKGREEE